MNWIFATLPIMSQLIILLEFLKRGLIYGVKWNMFSINTDLSNKWMKWTVWNLC